MIGKGLCTMVAAVSIAIIAYVQRKMSCPNVVETWMGWAVVSLKRPGGLRVFDQGGSQHYCRSFRVVGIVCLGK